MREEAANEIGRRIAAAYTSYIAGYKGVDRLLKKTPRRAGRFWYELAQLLFEGVGHTPEKDLLQRNVITKYIQ